ncbi:hypothetical protein GCM10022252_09690 [Streptosporangium oxazolinicum]|uniref:Uncharacterized protein n=1 Tax=Streptosporangium oxazolinicum TaxID=909287 RepID=A0ABP8AF56_9ACTN
MSSPDESADTSTPRAAGQNEADITYGVRWTPSHRREPTVIPSRDADAAHHQARRVRALQRTFDNTADAAAVYRTGDGEWMILLPTAAERLIEEFQTWLHNQTTAEPGHLPEAPEQGQGARRLPYAD